MANCLGEMYYDIVGKTTSFDVAIDKSGQKIEKFGKKLSVASAGIAAFYAVAISESNKFNASMANVATLVDGQIKSMSEYKAEVQDVAVATGTATEIMSDGLYQVVSAYGESAETIKQLELNAKAAKAGVATVTDAVNLTSAVTKAYGDTSSKAQQKVSDLAFTAVKLGQTTFPELAKSIQNVTSFSEKLSVSQEELFGSFATLTGVTGNASMVSTQLRGALVALDAPTDSLIGLYKKLGIESGQALIEQEGLQGAFQAIVDEANATNTPLQKYIGSVEGQMAATALAGSQADVYVEKLEQVRNASGATEEAFKKQTEGVNEVGFAYDQAKVKATVLAQKLGDELLPAFNKALDAISSGIDKFNDLDESTQKIILAWGGIVTVAGPAALAIGKMTQAAVALRLAMAGPAGFVIAGTAAVAILGTLAAKHILAKGDTDEHTKAVNKLVDSYEKLSFDDKYLAGINKQEEVIRKIDDRLAVINGRKNLGMEIDESELYVLSKEKAAEEETLNLLVAQYTEEKNIQKRRENRLQLIAAEKEAERKLAAQQAAQAEEDEKTAQKRVDIEQKYSLAIIDLRGSEIDQINAQREQALNDAKEAGVKEGEAVAQINEYYDELIAAKEKEIREAHWAEMDQAEKERADIRVQILGTESEKKKAILNDLYDHYLDIGFSEVEAHKLIEAQITANLNEETQERRQMVADAVSDMLDSYSSMYSSLTSLWNQNLENQIDSTTRAYKRIEKAEEAKLEAALEALEAQGLSDEEYLEAKTELEEEYEAAKLAREEEYEKAVAELEYKQQMNSWKAQVLNATARVAEVFMNSYASAAAIPIIGWEIAPIVAAAAKITALAQLATVVASKPQPPEFAEGGSFIVPTRPEYENDGFHMRVQSGERVDVTPADQMKHQGTMTGNIYIDSKKVGEVVWDRTRYGKWRIAGRSVV